ncbi:MAG: hypothetical protein ACRC2H_03095 [Silanimonas sp.]
MRAVDHFASQPVPVVLVAARLGLVGCGRGDDDDRPATGRTAPPITGPDHSAPDAAGAGASDSTAAPAPVVRSLRLAQSGWQFDLDAATSTDATRIDVLVRTATVGAAPQRLRIDADDALVDAFATDLDGDAAPELLLWTRGAGSSAEGEVRGWRFAANGDAAPLALPPLDDESAIGWRGRDQFGVQGDALVRSFPLYRDDDDNASPSAGFVRVIRYRLDAEGLVASEGSLEPMDGTPQADVLAR